MVALNPQDFDLEVFYDHPALGPGVFNQLVETSRKASEQVKDLATQLQNVKVSEGSARWSF